MEYTSRILVQCRAGLITVVAAMHMRMEVRVHSLAKCYAVRADTTIQSTSGTPGNVYRGEIREN